MNDTTTSTTFNLASRVAAWWARQREEGHARALRQCCPPATVAAGQIPPAVRARWATRAPQEFPGLPVDDAGWLHCSLGLAQFFEACRLQQDRGPCALPSKGADSLWHLWLQSDPDGLAAWQQRFYGRVVEHREAEQLGAPLEDGLARTWVGACRSEGRSAVDPRLPLVFRVDGELGLPTGWAYGYRRGRLVHRRIDGFGRPGGSFHEHAALAGAGLAALGLLTASETEELRRRASSDSGSIGSGATTSDCGDGASSCDGGGSSCGGGGD